MAAGREKKAAGGRDPGSEEQPSRLEWVVGLLSTLLVLSALGFIVYEALKGTDLPPMVTVQAGQAVPMDNGHVVEFTAYNSGGATARTLTVEGRLHDGSGRAVETSSATLTWVPAHAGRDGGLFFEHDPDQYRLEIRPQGYDRP